MNTLEYNDKNLLHESFIFSYEKNIGKNKLYENKQSYSIVDGKYNINNTTIDSLSVGRSLLTTDKEWSNSIYAYNKSTQKSLVAADFKARQLIKSYFNFYKSKRGTKRIRLARATKKLSLNKMLSSRTEIKHFNNKGIVTIYLYNRNRKLIEYRIKKKFNKTKKIRFTPKKLKVNPYSSRTIRGRIKERKNLNANLKRKLLFLKRMKNKGAFTFASSRKAKKKNEKICQEN